MMLRRGALLAAAAGAAAIPSSDIPRAHTPTTGGPLSGGCGYSALPPPVLANCTDPIAPGVPDMRGSWQQDGGGYWERIEQCSDRWIHAGDCVLHDFVHLDGTAKSGCNDLTPKDCTPKAKASGTYNATCINFHPVGSADLKADDGPTRCLMADGTLHFTYKPGGKAKILRKIPGYGKRACDQP